MIPNIDTLIEKYNDNVFEAFKYLDNIKIDYPERVVKPILKPNHTVEDVKNYTTQLIDYENSLIDYKLKKEKYNNLKSDINSLKEEFIKRASGLYDIPNKYQSKVYSYAYSQGHSYGHYEVYLKLLNLIEIFN